MWLSELFQVGIFATHLTIVLGILYFVLHKDQAQKLITKGKEKGIITAIVIASGGLLGSLLYSYVVQFQACVLCYIQRYILAACLAFLVVAYKTNKRVWVIVSLGATVAGFVVALYNSFLQWFPSVGASSFCNNFGGVSCSIRHVYAFGYITIPVMSLTVFALLLPPILLSLKKSEDIHSKNELTKV